MPRAIATRGSFSLSLSLLDIVWNARCHYVGCAISQNHGKRRAIVLVESGSGMLVNVLEYKGDPYFSPSMANLFQNSPYFYKLLRYIWGNHFFHINIFKYTTYHYFLKKMFFHLKINLILYIIKEYNI